MNKLKENGPDGKRSGPFFISGGYGKLKKKERSFRYLFLSQQKGARSMKVGCVKEIKNNEFRVGLTPDNVKSYAAAGHEVLIERGAGLSGIVCGTVAAAHDVSGAQRHRARVRGARG